MNESMPIETPAAPLESEAENAANNPDGASPDSSLSNEQQLTGSYLRRFAPAATKAPRQPHSPMSRKLGYCPAQLPDN